MKSRLTSIFFGVLALVFGTGAFLLWHHGYKKEQVCQEIRSLSKPGMSTDQIRRYVKDHNIEHYDYKDEKRLGLMVRSISFNLLIQTLTSNMMTSTGFWKQQKKSGIQAPETGISLGPEA